jgi:hypothetical protein
MYRREESNAGLTDRWLPDGLQPISAAARARYAISRVRQALAGEAGEETLDLDRLQSALAVTLTDAGLEAERCFALGWLRWLSGEAGEAVPLLAQAFNLLPAKSPEQVQAAYWLARTRLLARQPDALAAYEQFLRTLQSSPQATCWFVDLLWRGGRADRAEQVWKPLRSNRRMSACSGAFLQDARFLLRQADPGGAERVLREAQPAGGVERAERRLLLAWILATRRDFEGARVFLNESHGDLFPAPAFAGWEQFLSHQSAGEHCFALGPARLAGAEKDLNHQDHKEHEGRDFLSSSLRVLCGLGGSISQLGTPSGRWALSETAAQWVRGQEARTEGNTEQAVESLRSAQSSVLLKPYARYALACLGREDFANLLGDLPGPFLAARCRLWLTLARFCRGETTAGELTTAVQQAIAAGHGATGLTGWQRLARGLSQERPAELWPTPGEQLPEALASNRRRAAVTRTIQQLPPEKALPLLFAWSSEPGVREDGLLREALGRELLRLFLNRTTNSLPEAAKVLDACRALLGSSEFPDLVASLLAPALPEESQAEPDKVEVPPGYSSEAGRLWEAGQALCSVKEPGESWQTALTGLAQSPRGGGLAYCLLGLRGTQLQEGPALAELLARSDIWRSLSSGPPEFLLRAVQATSPKGLTPERWRQIVTDWLRLWAPAAGGPASEERSLRRDEQGGVAAHATAEWSRTARNLAADVGLIPADPHSGQAPAGTEPGPWFLHQASQALSRDDPRSARVWVRRALETDLKGHLPEGQRSALQAALPQLERQAQCQALAEVVCLASGQPRAASGLFADMRDLLFDVPEGRRLLAAAARAEMGPAREALKDLAGRTDLSPRLAHHLALVYLRAAQAFEAQEHSDKAEECWRLCWRQWLSWTARCGEGEDESGSWDLLLSYLLVLHRTRLAGLLARGEVDCARSLWELVRGLPALASAAVPPAPRGNGSPGLQARFAQFREELATDYLLATREAMRHGDVPEGWRGDYEQGLARLRRLLSLDRDNARLLTALVQICNDWFLDLYDAQDWNRLKTEVDRSTPFALHLARTAGRPGEGGQGDLSARTALADFFKFRAFIADDRERKNSLYREALRFNPANENVRDLLTSLDLTSVRNPEASPGHPGPEDEQ